MVDAPQSATVIIGPEDDISDTLPAGRWAMVRDGSVIGIFPRYPGAMEQLGVAVMDVTDQPGVEQGWTHDPDTGFAPPPGRDPSPAPTSWYVPVALLRERLEAAGLWEAAAGVLMAPENAPLMLKLFTLREGVANDDPQAAGLLSALGADPAELLARP